ncbi:hypothetical protein HDU98_008098 [Podochytrium sp. JEL0797]|nr:hypothetical protein HDU98_008098 [Podochytrium sp. JEL0797]
MSTQVTISYFSDSGCTNLYEYSVQPYGTTASDCLAEAAVNNCAAVIENNSITSSYQIITCATTSPTFENDFLTTAASLFTTTQQYVIIKQFMFDNTCNEANGPPFALVARATGGCFATSHLGDYVTGTVSTFGDPKFSLRACSADVGPLANSYSLDGLECYAGTIVGGTYWSFFLPSQLSPSPPPPMLPPPVAAPATTEIATQGNPSAGYAAPAATEIATQGNPSVGYASAQPVANSAAPVGVQSPVSVVAAASPVTLHEESTVSDTKSHLTKKKIHYAGKPGSKSKGGAKDFKPAPSQAELRAALERPVHPRK